MAIDLSSEFPAQVDTSDPTGYPYGKARNIVVSGDGIGTPWEERVANDIFGFQQALLTEADLTPSGTPDKVGASQYFQALQMLSCAAQYSVSGSAVADGSPFTLVHQLSCGGTFTLASNMVTVPIPGIYRVTFDVSVKDSSTVNPRGVLVGIAIDGGSSTPFAGVRYSAIADDVAVVHGELLVDIADHTNDKIKLLAESAGETLTIFGGEGAGVSRLLIQRVGST